MQGGQGIRITGVATPGGSITINVGPSDQTVEVGVLGTPDSTRYQVQANKDTPLPIPPVPAGTVLVIRVGKGPNRHRILITVVSPMP